jgi:choline-sulfatase
VSADRPNILFIIADQMAATLLSCTGNPHLSTPNLDRLAAGGIRFERAYCTNPVCVPSRFSQMTGRMPSEFGIRSDAGASADTVSEEMLRAGFGWRLREAGYRCLFGGKPNWLRGMTGEMLGFEDMGRACRGDLADLCVDFLGQEHEQPFCLCASFINPHDICFVTIDAYHDGQRERFLKSCPAEFDLVRRLAEPPPCVTSETFDGMLPPLPDNHEPQQDEPEMVQYLLDQRPFRRNARENWSERDWRLHRWVYHRLAERVDRHIGRVLDALETNGLAENTLVVMTSDHGDHDASHKLEHKTVLYEEAARVPLILRWPGRIPAGRVDGSHLVSNGLDLTPTLCAAAGLPRSPGLCGQSLLPLAEGHEPDGWRSFLTLENEIGRMLHFGKRKYIRYESGAHAEQFADLVADPGETRNHLDHPDLPKARALAEEIWS